MKTYKITILFLIIILMNIISGCWDSVEIDKRAFILGIAVDKGIELNQIETTYEMALTSKMGGEGTQGSQQGGTTWDISKSSDTLLQANNTMHENIDKVIDLEHLQTLILGGEIAKEGIYDELDFFFRHPQIRTNALIVYTDGKAYDILKTRPQTSKAPSLFISGIVEANSNKTHTIAKAVKIIELSQYIREKMDFVLPRVIVVNGTPKFDGAAAFRNGKLISLIEQGELEPIALTSGQIGMGEIEIPDPINPTQKLIYTISGGSGGIKPIFGDKKVDFMLALNIEGDIGEHEDTHFLGTNESGYIASVEKSVQDKIISEIKDVFYKYEKEKQVDVLDLQRKIKNYNIKFYEENKERLNEILADSDININVNVKIRRLGISK